MDLELSIWKKYQELEDRISAANSSLSYLNLGYWDKTLLVEEACKELVKQFSIFAEIAKNSLLLDVGIGYGDQLIYLLEKYPSITIHGIDLLQNHIDLATKKVASSKHFKRVKLEVGDATNLKKHNNQYDQVIAIESAFHFNTRQQFFKEAFTVLKPGGKLAIADVLISKQMINDEIVNRVGVPMANAYDIKTYKDLIKKAGFKNIKVKDISKYVLSYSALEVLQENGWRTKELLRLPNNPDNATIMDSFLKSTAIESYYFISATK